MHRGSSHTGADLASDRPTVVVGAGVVGVMTAYALVKRGRRIALIDALPGPAELCSRAALSRKQLILSAPGGRLLA